MKLRLIQPSQLNESGRPTKFDKLFFPNLTLPTLAAITPSGVDVGITMEYVEDIDFDEDADLVALTAQTCQAPRAYQIADEFRKRGKRTIVGGIHASMCQDEALRHFDSILIGEAEDIWPAIIDDAKHNRLQKVYEAPGKPNLDALAVPRFDLIDYSQYVVPPMARTPLMPLQTTRGCPHFCDFCSVSQYFGRKIRTKPVANVLTEIECIRPSRVFFVDDNIAGDTAYAAELFAALKPLKMRWACQMSTTIGKRPDLIEAAAEAGCHETFVGLETFNQESLSTVNKGFNKVDEYRKFFKMLSNVGILAQVSFILGLDKDTKEHLKRSIDLIMELDANYLYLTVLTPLPGTPLRERLLSEGRILVKDWSAYDFANVVVQPKNMTPEELKEVLWETYERFYSFEGILQRAWRFKRQYVKFFPRDNAVEEIYFQIHQRSAVRQKTYPFTMGLEKKNGK